MKPIKTLIFSFLSLLALSCHEKEAVKPAENKVISVRTAQVTFADYSEPIHSAGVIASDIETNLSFKITGIIERMYVQEGETVRKGQLLAVINQTEINSQVQQAKNDYDKAERNYSRMRNLFDDNAATKEELENSETSLNSFRQQYTITKFNKQYAAIYANQSGIVLKKNMNEGEMASAGSIVYVINSTQKDDWIIRLGLSDKDWVRIKKGDRATVDTDAYPNSEFQAIVSEIGMGADPSTGLFSVKLKIDPNGKKLATGLASKVKINPSSTEKIHFIPVASLVEVNDDSGIIYTLNDNGKSVKQMKVKILFTENDRVAISNGFEITNELITDGSAFITPNSMVKKIK